MSSIDRYEMWNFTGDASMHVTTDGKYILVEDLIERLHSINLDIVFEQDAPLKPIFKLLKELGANV